MARYETGGPNIIRKVGSLFTGGGEGPPVFRPGGSDSEDEPKKRSPIGVPEGYTTMSRNTGRYSPVGGLTAASMGRTPGTFSERGPRYFDGDEWRPANNSPAGIAEAQKFLAAAGLLTGNWRWGVWDDKTRNAWKDVLSYANARGITDQMALQELATSQQSSPGGGGAGGGGGGGQWTIDENGNPVFVEETFVPPPLELRTTNKKDLERAFRGAIREKLGVGWSDAQIRELVDAYNWQEVKVQSDAYEQEVARLEDEFYGRPSDVKAITQVDVESPETFVENEARRRDLGGFQATQVAEDYAPAFFDALGGFV